MGHTIKPASAACLLTVIHCALCYTTSTARAVDSAGAFCACAPITRSCSLAWPCRKRPVTCAAGSTVLRARDLIRYPLHIRKCASRHHWQLLMVGTAKVCACRPAWEQPQSGGWLGQARHPASGASQEDPCSRVNSAGTRKQGMGDAGRAWEQPKRVRQVRAGQASTRRPSASSGIPRHHDTSSSSRLALHMRQAKPR